MAKFKERKHEGRITTITTKSFYGSHKEMIVGEVGDFLILKDDRGQYLTTPDQLDTGLVDHNRATRLNDNYRIEDMNKFGVNNGNIIFGHDAINNV